MLSKTKKSKRGVSLQSKMAWHGYVFTSPLIIGFFLIFIWVLIDSLKFSFGSIQLTLTAFVLKNVGWENYRNVLFVNPTFIRTVTDTIIKMFTDIPIIIFFSLFIATLLNQKMKGRTFFRVIFFIPVILATGIIAKSEINNYMMNALSSATGIDMGNGNAVPGGMEQLAGIQMYLRNISFNPQITKYVAEAVNNIYEVINRSGVQILLFLAGIQSISPSIYEAAKVEGATGWEEFWKITFPMLGPVIFVNAVYTIIDSFIRPENPIMDMIHTAAFKQSQYGIASAMAWLYFIVVMITVGIIAFVISRMVFYQKRD